ncbi:MAG: Stp1/IreP family PP2C-type Ser/Thr phosphatase, partial [Chloroflexota bacterium]|nr:Stp1/IreP family PP2C-type Ser/Thr phosphatase [Chloroflexota bacterium]
KQLRLEVAQLTDVGRKREHNEDNMAYVIPKDPQVMAKKGALFIVADGMGGHAAGEVASEIAVDTVSNVYYQDDSDDAATSLLHAIKRANALIHQRAAENMLRSGMGTTCVAAVLRGNMAYIANVGDSRAYLVRNGQVKQVSQDHSWVAEQVRAGLLTEDQARTHAQRNVITRCLGTQADVEIDVFPEQLEDKDALVLCTDGLSGLVSDDEIRRIVGQSIPQDSVYHLVQRANENGGPDNITAIVISVQEAGWEPPHVRHPVPVGGREVGEDTTLLGMPSGSPTSASTPVVDAGRVPSSPLRFSSGPLAPDELVTAPQPVLYARRWSRSRLLYPLLALLTLFILATVGGGIFFFLQAKTGTQVTQQVQDARKSIDKANAEVATNPTSALHDLASAQSSLRALLQDPSLAPSQHNSVLHLLQNNLTKSVQTAIVTYNTHSSIMLLCLSNATTNAINNGSTGTQAKIITQVMAKVKGKSAPDMYALGTDNKLYQVNNNSLLAVPLPISADTKVINLASNGSQLVLLTQQPTKAGASTPNDTYTLNLFSPVQAQSAHPSFASSSQIDPRLIKPDLVPSLIAAAGTDVYVVFGSDTVRTTTLIMDYFPKANRPLVQTSQSTLSFSTPIKSVAAFPNHELFFLLDGGSLQSIQLSSGAQATNVLVDKPLEQPLATGTTPFSWQTPVPTVSQAGTNALAVLGTTSSSALGVSTENGEPHLYIMDTTLHRILELKTPSGGSAGASTPGITPTSTTTGGGVANNTSPVTLQLAEQYVSPTLLAQPRSMAVDTQNTQVNVLSQNSPAMPALISFHSNPQNTSCA